MLNDKAIARVLHILSKRINPNINYANEEHWLLTAGSKYGGLICLICGAKIADDNDAVYGSNGHAFKHIKEHNLTAFL